MARPIGITPTLEGEDAKKFLKEMGKPPSKEDIELNEKIKKQRKVLFKHLQE